jgi:hypothetical protein
MRFPETILGWTAKLDEFCVYARPHPDLLPPGEGKAVGSFWFCVWASGKFSHADFQKKRRTFLPLLGGEGRGEVEREPFNSETGKMPVLL